MGLFKNKQVDDPNAIDFNKRGWFDKAKPLADAGDPEIQFQMALAIFGDRFMQDKMDLAFDYLRRSSDSGNDDATATLSRIYYLGVRGTDFYRDNDKASEYAEKTPNDPISKYVMGMQILEGVREGTPDDAAMLLLDAAEGGIEDARIYAAFIYASDLTGKRDAEKAIDILSDGLKSKKTAKRCRGYINSLKKNPNGDVRLSISVHDTKDTRIKIIDCDAEE